MKAVILAGGLGTRISEETHLKPKPMIEIGGYPILWHILKIYSYYGINDFIICSGYKGYVIKEYFSNYQVFIISAIVISIWPLAPSGNIFNNWLSIIYYLSIPLLLLAWSVFSDDPNIQAKIDIFFDKFSNLPLFYQTLVVGSFSAILGIRGASVLKKK